MFIPLFKVYLLSIMFLNIPLVITVLLHSITSFLGLNYIHITRQYEIHGIDVSHHQRFIDWEKVAEHSQFKVSFTFLKATEGTTIRDTRFETNWKESKEAGLVRGAYHFFSATSSPYTQAQNYIRTVDLAGGDLAPVLDFEIHDNSKSPALMRKNVEKWISIVEKHYGCKVIIYTNTHIYNKYLRGYFKNNPLWIADYNFSNVSNLVGHPKLKFWQYTEKGRIMGINGNVDINAFLGDTKEFDALKIPEENYEIELEVESVSSK
jgi:lysozyme